MTKKKQQYIYVSMSYSGVPYVNFGKFKKDCYNISDKSYNEFKKIMKKLNLKKGEQKRIPIDIDKAEVV
jgi:hypothetical protein